jgi:hypothetical protein
MVRPAAVAAMALHWIFLAFEALSDALKLQSLEQR